MTPRRARLSRRIFTAALILTTVGLFVATGMLYVAQDRQRQLLATSIRTSGWVAYQAQLEYVKTSATLDLGRESLPEDIVDRLSLRLELLYSRIGALYGSQDGKALPGIEAYVGELRPYEATISGFLARLEQPLPPDFAAKRMLSSWRAELAPLGETLQKILERSVVYNEAVYARERELAGGVTMMPLLLMFLSGSGLIALLRLQAQRDRDRLDDVLAARRAQAVVESNFRAAIESMPSVIVIFDPVVQRVSFVNKHAAELIDPSPHHPAWQRLISAALDSGKEVPGQSAVAVNLAFSRPDGLISSLRGSFYDVTWEGRTQRLLALADVTKIRDAELQVMQAAKLATLGEMATAIAHEANQPLAVIRMAVTNAKRLYENGEVGEALNAKLTRISDQVERVKRITDQVRRYGRMGSSIQEPFVLKEAIGLAISFVAEQYRAAGLRLDIDVDLPLDLNVVGEQTMFEQVIVNLLVNARDACESRQSNLGDPIVTVRTVLEGNNVAIQVEDNAGGINPAVMNRLFEPFATTKPAGKGTGLGLSVSRNIVRDMNGDIIAQNVGSGARFTVRLPVAMARMSVEEAA
ncbi:ATP-binding protein [Afifella sp. IM 167]|uniref:ATP-binding protein n=1 Tax=Afifella sp. IM 167 TaxID=2033586 RepID=UPI001CCA95E3|nr:ATP-binding protein [Afifella sp. IM 167]MBZ8131763.1 hypothetical protein [Afifella sp. IM 167]